MTPKELQEAMVLLPEPITDKRPPFWEYWRWELWHHVVDGDDPYGFYGWPCIYHTMLQNHWPSSISKEADEMIGSGGIYSAVVNHVEPFYPADPIVLGHTHSKNMIHQLYHLWRWEQASGKKVSSLTSIEEFGGGYGAMALMAHRLGFKGRYVICDLPEFALLQRFFLEEVGVEVQWQKKPLGKFDLAIACYSLSEVSMTLRNTYANKLKADNYLFLYSDRFAEFDNVSFFNEFIAGRSDLHWATGPNIYLPPTSIYSFGFQW